VQHAERCGATRMYLLASEDWDNGLVRVKELMLREEHEVPVSEILPSS
jgi:histidyl-tRNA synthetase